MGSKSHYFPFSLRKTIQLPFIGIERKFIIWVILQKVVNVLSQSNNFLIKGNFATKLGGNMEMHLVYFPKKF